VTLSESPLQLSCHGATLRGLLRTQLDHSAERRDQTGDVRSGRVSARSARTRIFRHSRRGRDTRTHGFKINLARKWQLAKYRGVCVNHLTSPPCRDCSRQVSPLQLCLQPRPVEPVSPLYLFDAYNLPARALSRSWPRRPPVRSLLFYLRGEPRLRDLDAVLRYPYCYRSRSDNRLEDVAYAHTAADLHVRPVSKTALVRDRGRREQLTNTTCGADGNKIDSKFCARRTARHALQQRRCLPRKSNAMIHFADSTRATTVTFSSKWKIKVTSLS
jgi:hypothetical protein